MKFTVQRTRSRRRMLLGLVTLCALLGASNESAAQQMQTSSAISVAAAADLSTVLQELGVNFQKKTGIAVKFSFAASGALMQQIENGAPFDLFFSADMDYPRQLIAAGEADSDTLYQYAVGTLVIWVPSNSSLDLEHRGMQALLDPSVKKIAIANPKYAPYGRAAVTALKHEGIYQKVINRVVVGENVSQAAQFVGSGNAQAGFVPLSHALAPRMQGGGRYWKVPTDDYPPLAQGAVVISRSPHKKEATEFLLYMKTADAAELLRKYGFK